MRLIVVIAMLVACSDAGVSSHQSWDDALATFADAHCRWNTTCQDYPPDPGCPGEVAHVMNTETKPALDPSPILQTAFAFWSSKVLLTAVEFDVFTKLGSRARPAQSSGRNLACTREASRFLRRARGDAIPRPRG